MTAQNVGHSEPFDVVIIGGGASGTALAYTLATYTNIPRIALVEKNSALAMVNSNVRNNSQTLHVGDIETNYSVEKVKSVLPASMMVVRYVEKLPADKQAKILTSMHKMILAVGADEVAALEKRFVDLQPLFPALKKLSGPEIAVLEPAIMEKRNPAQPVLALYNPTGYAVNFEALANSFIQTAKERFGDRLTVFLNQKVQAITPTNDRFSLQLPDRTITTRSIVVDADAYSLQFAKKLGYGKEFSLIPIAGTFYFSKAVLKGKVYTMQEPRLPFAAVHGDPDILAVGQTRWGPTARFFPVLESRNWRTLFDYFASSGLHRFTTWVSLLKILFEPVRFFYLLRNVLYEIPFFGKRLFVKSVQKIVPSITARDLRVATGFGGMRLQRVDTRTSELQLGEGKIVGNNILFNMTPSPGASVCLYNAMRDTEIVIGYLKNKYQFDVDRLQKDLLTDCTTHLGDVSSRDSYAS